MIMPNNKIYVIDTNILINFSDWVPIRLNNIFWNDLEGLLAKDRWILLDVVVGEIKSSNKDLHNWCMKQKNNDRVKKIEDNDRNRAVEINNNFPMIDETTGRSTVDTYVIAYAEKHNLKIFSKESGRALDNQLFKIPDVCKELSIPYTRTPKVFLREVGITPN
ncbi:MAG: DUF4411 family protein [Candidatus Pacebacteria bacterium]|nr:DUF4411 family protein [Candidatus Paceibacterota bacterium]